MSVRRLILATALLLPLTAAAGGAGPPPAATPSAELADSMASVPGLPPVGRWMIDRDGSVAHWLGVIYEGKQLYEPINLILVDSVSTSEAAARSGVVAALKAAGYEVRFGHSAGYRGLIGGQSYAQLPQGRDDAFSDHPFDRSNDHGRVFGPHRIDGAFVFVGAFSRERVNLAEWPSHRFDSFDAARDAVATGLRDRSGYASLDYVSLGNAVGDDPATTTADHDGRAALLRMAR